MLFSLCIEAQTTLIPDANFEEYLETHAEDGSVVDLGDDTSMGDGISGNGLVQTSRIENVVLLDVSNLGISNLSGIEDFNALQTLFCNNNSLDMLDVSSNLNLVSLVCGSNGLTVLEVNANVDLETLDCSENQILDLDVSDNLNLFNLTASGNQMSSIDVSNNTELTVLNVSDNRIEGELLIAVNTNLERLFCASNQISILNLSSNTLLRSLDASDNALTALDLSNMNSVVCPDPQTDPITSCQDDSLINVSRNLLTSLIVNNGFNDLISVFDASDNSNLFCIQIDNDFMPNGWIKDNWVYYSDTICEDIYTYVPDDNFEQALIDQSYDDVIDNLVLTTSINAITSLDVTSNDISNLEGIEDFTALELLNCSSNAIESIDVSLNALLEELNISGNSLSALDLSSNTDLQILNCSSNSITSLNLEDNATLSVLECANNDLTALNLTNNMTLLELNCSMNQIESLNLMSNVNVTSVIVNDNDLFALNIGNGNNGLIATFNATTNPNLSCIDVDDVAFANAAAGWQKDASASYSLNCGTYVPDDNFEQALIDQGIDSDGTLNNFVPSTDVTAVTVLNVSSLGISDLTGIQDFLALQNLNVSNNVLVQLELINNSALEILDCSMNQIEDLDLTSNTALTSVLCNYNALETLNIENTNNVAISFFDATENSNLFCINVDDAIIGSIPMSWQKDDIASYNGDCINNRFTLIPDVFFEQSIIDLGLDDVIDGQVLTSNIEHLQSIDVSDNSISDLTGIRDFKSLIQLDCSGNFLEELDVSDMIHLERLNCSSNYLLTNDSTNTLGLFNTSGTANLTELYCAGNNLNDLDLSQNLNLELLDCADNNLMALELSNNISLSILNCSNNAIGSLDISNNPSLEDVNCDNNSISIFNTSNTSSSSMISIRCANNNVSEVEIGNYPSLVTLNCSSNEITNLNVNTNTDLAYLYLTDNQVSNINLENNTGLVEVNMSQNDLSQLDVSQNINLELLRCDFNNIDEILLTTNSLLEVLTCSNNQLTSLDLTTNINLIECNSSANAMTSVLLSNNLGSLKVLNLSNNQIEGDINLSSMAVSACIYDPAQTEFCPENITINLSNNLFDFVNIQNGINSEIRDFNATSNPNLECIQVDDENEIGINWLKDEATMYNVDCNFGETYVPDDNFEQALIDLGYDSLPLNDYVPTMNIENVTSLNVGGNAITDFTGIEDFESLEVLNCSSNAIAEIDLSSNINLINLNCANNQLAELELISNENLEVLNCSGNLIDDLDLILNTSLVELHISNNNFISFLPSDIESLQVFDCSNNAILELDFQENQSLTSLNCQSNSLETLNVRNGQNAILTNLEAQNNPDLLCIETDTGSVPAGANWIADPSAQFAVECFFGQTFVPDDNFEQALVNLGYDSGTLDDYVTTANIEQLSFLNIENAGISDPTGLQDFISLTSLSLEGNDIAAIDISANTLLVNIDVSGNQLTQLDVSNHPDLIILDVSNNSFSAINIANNNNLIDLDISNNLITNLDVNNLISLEELNCAANQIGSLNLTQNTNLSVLFCQSNELIGDQLNIQNGNNQFLQLFNASNNPNLGCILVDNPIAVIENTEGIYDNWIKDESASYQSVCDDADNDGVANVDDLCPGTEFGVQVDLFGCPVIDFSNDNFTVLVTGETCLNSNNGKIRITAQQINNYTVTLTAEDIIEEIGEDFYQEYNFTNDADILNLLAGTYEMCITIEEWPNYESCYTIVITQPDPLEVFASRLASGNEVSLELSGNSSYTIELNGVSFITHNSNITLPLTQGINDLKVSTAIECQGVYQERILLGHDFLVFPNPFKDAVNVFNGIGNETVSIQMYSAIGQLVLSKTVINNVVDIILDTSSLKSGLYVMIIQTETLSSSHKIVKK